MNNAKFWNKKNDGGLTQSNDIGKLNINNKLPMKNKLSMKLGVTGIVMIAILGVLITLGYLFLIRPAYSVLAAVKTVQRDADSIGTSLKDRDLVALEKNLKQTEKDLTALRKSREDNFGWAKNMGLFKLNEFYSDSDKFINAGFYGIDAMREASVIVLPFADAAGLKIEEGQEVPEEQGLMEAFQSWVSIMPEVAGQMDGVIEKVSKIGKEFESINTAKYPEEINGVAVRSNLEFIKNTLSKSGEYGPDIKVALSLFPKLLAVDTPEKRYMIIMQNDKELRPTGGFMTNYATFKINNGLLQSDFSSKDMYSIDLALDAIDATYDFPDPPAAYTKYLLVERWYARDMNASPDFITSMDQFLKFYTLAGRLNPYEIKPVDGIVAIDTQVVKELLEVTGPATVNGVTYTSENVVLELEKIASLELREQLNRKKVLGDLMEAMLINVFEADKNLWPKMIDKAINLATRKHILVYMFDPEAQALIEKYNFAGRVFDKTEGDYSMVVSTNLGGDKTNWFTHKKVTHTIAKENNKWVRTVKIDYTYTQPSDEYAPFVKRFKDWVRVYAPIGSSFISVEGSEDGTSTDQERNRTYFTGYIELGPNETKSMTFKYALPDNLITNGTYTLTIQKQPGIDSETHVVIVNGKSQEILLNKDTKVSSKL
ncbi:hypothetical protein A2415_04750 [candidate division WWE3 bacterium RIFOXYC1_FULL_39_7]|uniref:DUF4012 domain-containing protein n=2 Tax=Katanobacteria TaxID=422282 RepID=A0A1F4X6Q6_UNCKA|nr:MAG: hypothetical protein A2415_04750 [candidate division WWE3 bacterium RIFOXYC1_FULL_39_7]OGC77309.1 MAG: hypothetical protein A2619_04710 [candidate division WWE3 bacterium RIFOXYD1_FULL_39_9]